MILAALLFLAVDASAWGPDGHAATALIAQKHLTPKASAAVRDLLGVGVGLDQIASCADWMRDKKTDVACAGFTLPYIKDTEAWHVLAVPLTASPALDDFDGYCQPGDACPTRQIAKQLAVLGSLAATRHDKQVALAFVVHLVGDLHQPLHCAADRDDGPFRRRFGNTKPVVFFGKSLNLHHLWDVLVENDKRSGYGGAAALAQRLETEARFKPPETSGVAQTLDAAAAESFALAKDVYADYTQDDGRELGADYKKRMQPLVFGRLAYAGLRLAALLNGALR